MSRAANAPAPPSSSIGTAFYLLLLTLAVYLLWRLYSRPRPRPELRSVGILVLGDIGRSPRMMYHAESFAKNNFLTYLVGYGGSKPIPSLLASPHVSIIYLTEPPPGLRRVPFIVGGPLKVLRQILEIVYALAVRIPHPPEFILVQNPPSIPTLAIVWLVSKMRGCKVIIDWHNLGYSILALRLGESHPFVKIAKWFESYFGRSAYAHLFVTNAMRNHLVQEWNLQGQKVVLHDRPPSWFHRAEPPEIHDLFQRLLPALSDPASALTPFLPPSEPPYSTPFTRIPSVSSLSPSDTAKLGSFSETVAMPALRADRTALIVSSTSWTPDEDFGMLLDALKEYEMRARASEERPEAERLPKVLAIVTGKGPLKQKYMQEVQKLQIGHSGGASGEEGSWRFVRCVSLWLEADDYPLLLGSADIGVSLHSSSSALDLPMKVVDMFGCGLPVCALGFACLDELVKDGINGLVFHNAEQLAAQLESLLRGFPSPPGLATLRASFERKESVGSPPKSFTAGGPEWEWGTWAENWDRVMRPLLLHDVASEAQL
ncbi:mannosyltransferase [Ganoderma leucocontextum]|nr:mannosyltransferase [Ganoderma leucocontextum]